MWYIIHYNDEYGDAAVVNIVNACSTPKKEEQEMLEKVLLNEVTDRIAGLCSCSRDIATKAMQAFADTGYNDAYWDGYMDEKPSDDLMAIEFVSLNLDTLSAKVRYSGCVDLITASWYESMTGNKIEEDKEKNDETD